jgi:hypothetical protein
MTGCACRRLADRHGIGEITAAFILRRVELIAQGAGTSCSGLGPFLHAAHQEFLTRNNHPIPISISTRSGRPDAAGIAFVAVADVPVVSAATARCLNPTNQEIARCLGFNEAIDGRTCATW